MHHYDISNLNNDDHCNTNRHYSEMLNLETNLAIFMRWNFLMRFIKEKGSTDEQLFQKEFD